MKMSEGRKVGYICAGAAALILRRQRVRTLKSRTEAKKGKSRDAEGGGMKMSEGRKVGYICAGAAALALMLSLLILRGTSEGTPPLQNDYEEKLFDRSRVHEIDLEVEDWDLSDSEGDVRGDASLAERLRREAV